MAGWFVQSDLGGVYHSESGGTHPTQQAALEAMILALESERSEVMAKIKTAKQQLRLARKQQCLTT